MSEASPTESAAALRIRDNPFYVLGLRPDATRQAIERQGTKLLGMLELKLKSAAAYPTPVGRAERTPEKVRAAMAELRDPARRLDHEIWARLDPEALPAPEPSAPLEENDPAPARATPGPRRSPPSGGGAPDMNGALAGIIASAVISMLGPKNKGPGKAHVPLTAAVWSILVPIGLALFSGVLAGHIHLLPPLLAIIALALPWTTTRLVLIPLGLPRLAYWLARSAEVTFDGDLHGGAALAGAWALLRRREPDEAATAWLEDRLRPAQVQTIGGAGILASGLLLAARGDRDGARAVIRTVSEIDPRACPAAARRLAAGVARGGRGLARRVGRGRRDRRRLRLRPPGLAALRRRPVAPRRAARARPPRPLAALGDRPEPPRHAPHRPPRPRRARRRLPRGRPQEPAPRSPAVVAADDWSNALARHAAVLTKPIASVEGADLLTLGRAWDAILEDRVAERILAERALLLGEGSSARTLARLREAVEDDLTALVLSRELALDTLVERGAAEATPSPTIDRVRRRVRDHLLVGVEASSDALRRRLDEKRELPAVDEWREWTTLRLAYEHGARLAGQDFRRLAFYKVHPDITSLAVWLFNDRQQRPLGNAMFKWLLAEATALDDARAIALQSKNVACGI